jgi:PilZ domain
MPDPQITDARELLRRVADFGARLKSQAEGEQKEALWAATVEIQGKQFDGLIVDFSPGGARIHFAATIATESEVALVLNELDALGATVVWQSEGKSGVQFLLAPEEVAARVRRRPDVFDKRRRA